MARPVAPRGTGRAVKGVSPVVFVVAGAVFLGLLIVAARLFAPEKPVTPPASRVEYTPSEAAFPPHPGQGSRGGSADTPEAAEEGFPLEAQGDRFEGAAEEPILVHGKVTDADTGKLLIGTLVNGKREWTQADLTAWRQAKSGAATAAPTETSENDPDAVKKAENDADALEERLNAERKSYTNKDGEYAFRISTPGRYRVSAWRQGFMWQSDATRSDNSSRVIEIKEGETDVRIDLKLSRGASISGRVTERGTGRGAADIRVFAWMEQSGAFGDAKTDKNGHYKLSTMATGEAEVAVQIDDVPYQFAGLPPRRLVEIKDLKQEVKNVDFVVDPAGIIWGYVLDETGKPVKGANVVQCNSDSVVAQVAESVTRMRAPVHDNSNKEGLYRLCGVPLNRECRVFVMADDHSPQLSEPLLLTLTKREARVDVYLLAGANVYGRVVSSEDRSPVSQAQINCIPAISRLLSPFNAALGFREERTGDDGTFAIPHLPPGEHKLFAMAEGYKLSLVGEPIFSDGFSDIRVEMALDPVGTGEHTVFGVVTGSSGRPIAEARVSLTSLSLENLQGSGERTAITDAEGRYLFEGVDEGYMMLMAEAPGHAPASVDDVRLDEATDIELEAAARVSGRVIVRETGKPPESHSVRAMPTSVQQGDLLSSLEGLQSRSFTGENGAFEFELPAGSYTLIGSAPGTTSGSIQVTVDSGETEDGLEIEVSQNGGSISGRVVTRDGRSPAGATVMLGQEGASFADIVPMLDNLQNRTASVAEDGSFRITQLPAGVYRLTAQLSGYADGRSNPVSLQNGQAVGGVQIVLGSGGRLQGTVTIKGELTPGAAVTVVGGGISRMTTADRNGQYVFEDLPAGEYLASAISVEQAAVGQFAPSHGRVVIQEGQTTVFNFGESTGATIEGLCTPVPSAGSMAFAVLRIAGTGEDVARLDFRNLLGWFTGNTDSAPYVVGLAQLDRDGYFVIENAPQGSYSLDVYYLTLGNLINSSGRRVYSQMINITGQEAISLQIAIPAS